MVFSIIKGRLAPRTGHGESESSPCVASFANKQRPGQIENVEKRKVHRVAIERRELRFMSSSSRGWRRRRRRDRETGTGTWRELFGKLTKPSMDHKLNTF